MRRHISYSFKLNQSLDHNVSGILVFCCLLTSFICLSASCLSFQFDVARYACVTKTSNLLDNKTKSVWALMSDSGLTDE